MRVDIDNRRYSKNYAEFASQIITDICAAGYSASSRSLEARWKNPQAEASTRELIDIEMDPSIPHRLSVITVDLQYIYSDYINGASAEITLKRALKDVGISVKSEELNAIFMEKAPLEIIPRDATCLAPCLDGGASLKAYHDKIGYIPFDSSIYKTGLHAELGRAASSGADCENELETHESNDHEMDR